MRETVSERQRERERETDRQTVSKRETYTHANIQYIHTGRQIDIHTDRQIDR